MNKSRTITRGIVIKLAHENDCLTNIVLFPIDETVHKTLIIPFYSEVPDSFNGRCVDITEEETIRYLRLPFGKYLTQKIESAESAYQTTRPYCLVKSIKKQL